MGETFALYRRAKDDRRPEHEATEVLVALAEHVSRAEVHFLKEDDGSDPCDARTTLHTIRVKPPEDGDPAPDPEEVRTAIRWTFRSKGGCGHDYDCCGCRTYGVGFAVQARALAPWKAADEWVYEINSFRNY